MMFTNIYFYICRQIACTIFRKGIIWNNKNKTIYVNNQENRVTHCHNITCNTTKHAWLDKYSIQILRYTVIFYKAFLQNIILK